MAKQKKQIFKFLLLVLFLLSFLFLPQTTLAISLEEIGNNLGLGLVYLSSNESNLNIDNPEAGVYEIIAQQFPCAVGSPGCDPDAYQITFPRQIVHFYGLGMQASANMVEVKLNDQGEYEELADLNFSSGHIRPGGIDGPEYNDDIGRLRTPMLVFPQEPLIIAYLQPVVKKVIITRQTGETKVVFKKHDLYSEGEPGRLLLVKGSDLKETYQKYYSALKRLGFYFKKPHFQIFGLNWETRLEYGMRAPFPGGANVQGLEEVINQYEKAGLKLATLTFGSGYWSTDTDVCSVPSFEWGGIYRKPTIEGLCIKDPALKDFFDSIYINKGIYPRLGMRHHASINNGNCLTESGEEFINNKFDQNGIANPFLPGNYYYHGETERAVRLLDFTNASVISRYIDMLRQAYGNFKGIKEDEMIFGDQKHFDLSYPNLPDGKVSKAYSVYDQKFDHDFVITGRNDWFGVATDAQNGQGWVDVKPPAGIYETKYLLDSALTQIASGYPHPKIEAHYSLTKVTGDSACDSVNCSDFCGFVGNNLETFNHCCQIPLEKQEEYIRNFQLLTFSPVTASSIAFWHLKNEEVKNNYIFFAQLRMRLHQYAYDQSQRWYETGLPYLMRPLFIDYPDDQNVYSVYTQLDPSDKTSPKNEYLFGNALLVRPIFFNNLTDVSVYFPPGQWRALLKPMLITSQGEFKNYHLDSLKDFPVFLKEGEILIIADPTDLTKTMAYVFLDQSGQSSIYQLYHQEKGMINFQARKKDNQVFISNLNNNQSILMEDDAYGKGFKIADISSLITDSQPKKPGDVNGDGLVDEIDYAAVITYFGQEGTPGTVIGDVYPIDIPDGIVDERDYATIINFFGS